MHSPLLNDWFVDVLVAQTVKNLLAMQETGIRSLGGDPLEEEMATHFSILAWRINSVEKCNYSILKSSGGVMAKL